MVQKLGPYAFATAVIWEEGFLWVDTQPIVWELESNPVKCPVTILRNWLAGNILLIFIKAASFELHFFRVFLMWISQVRLQSKVTPSTFMYSLLLITVPALSSSVVVIPLLVNTTASVLPSLTTKPRLFKNDLT